MMHRANYSSSNPSPRLCDDTRLRGSGGNASIVADAIESHSLSYAYSESYCSGSDTALSTISSKSQFIGRDIRIPSPQRHNCYDSGHQTQLERVVGKLAKAKQRNRRRRNPNEYNDFHRELDANLRARILRSSRLSKLSKLKSCFHSPRKWEDRASNGIIIIEPSSVHDPAIMSVSEFHPKQGTIFSNPREFQNLSRSRTPVRNHGDGDVCTRTSSEFPLPAKRSNQWTSADEKEPVEGHEVTYENYDAEHGKNRMQFPLLRRIRSFGKKVTKNSASNDKLSNGERKVKKASNEELIVDGEQVIVGCNPPVDLDNDNDKSPSNLRDQQRTQNENIFLNTIGCCGVYDDFASVANVNGHSGEVPADSRETSKSGQTKKLPSFVKEKATMAEMTARAQVGVSGDDGNLKGRKQSDMTTNNAKSDQAWDISDEKQALQRMTMLVARRLQAIEKMEQARLKPQKSG